MRETSIKGRGAHANRLASVAAGLLMFAAAGALALAPISASEAAPGTINAKASATEGGTGPDTSPPDPPPPPPGVKPMDPTSGWVFPIHQVDKVFSPSGWSLDQGVDLGGNTSFCGNRSTLVAVDDAIVSGIGISGFGSSSPVIRLTHGPYKGRQVYYGHSAPVLVKKGQKVKRGQAIARIGCGNVGISSAPHLEIGIYRKGQAYCCPSWGETAGLMKSLLLRMWPTAIARRNNELRRARLRS